MPSSAAKWRTSTKPAVRGARPLRGVEHGAARAGRAQVGERLVERISAAVDPEQHPAAGAQRGVHALTGHVEDGTLPRNGPARKASSKADTSGSSSTACRRSSIRSLEPGGGNVATRQLERDLPRIDPDHPQARNRLGTSRSTARPRRLRRPGRRHPDGPGSLGEPLELRGQDIADDLREDRRVLAQALEELDVRVRPARLPRRIREQVDRLEEQRPDRRQRTPELVRGSRRECSADTERLGNLVEARLDLSGRLLPARLQAQRRPERREGLGRRGEPCSDIAERLLGHREEATRRRGAGGTLSAWTRPRWRGSRRHTRRSPRETSISSSRCSTTTWSGTARAPEPSRRAEPRRRRSGRSSKA